MKLPFVPLFASLPRNSGALLGATALAAVLSAPACIIGVADGDDDVGDDSQDDSGIGEPCVDGANNHVNIDGECVCDAGFTWCDPLDNNNLYCCAIDGTTATTTDGSTDTDGGTGGTGDTGDTEGGESNHPQGPCTPAEEGFAWCSHSEAMGPEGSVYYVCELGTWVAKSLAELDQFCQGDGFDFAYGCVTTPTSAEISCGLGPGTPCDASLADHCVGTDDPPTILAYCWYGRVSHQNCAPEPGTSCMADGMEFEFGKCGEQEGVVSCLCYDEEIGTEDTGDETSDDSETTD